MAKDESYVIDLCDDVLGHQAKRQHRFDFLRGDPNRRGLRAMLPVDAYYPEECLVIEYWEKQHTEPVPQFDKKMTCSGCTRGEQRSRYDTRKREILSRQGIRLCVLSYKDFAHTGSKRLRKIALYDSETIIRALDLASKV